MEKRRSKRSPVNLESWLVFDGINYSGFFENICDYGLHVIAASPERVESFIPESTINIEFHTSAVENVNLDCEVRWVHINKTPIHGLTYRMGMEIK